MKSLLVSVLLALAALALAAIRINPGLTDSRLLPGPGLTLDESFNVLQGVYLCQSFAEHGLAVFTPTGAQTVFGAADYLPDHPPLGRIQIGLAHQLAQHRIRGADQSVLNIAAARLGACFAFAVTVLLLSESVRRQFDLSTAIVAAVSLMLMPRVIGHARLASLETATTLAWLVTFVPLWTWWTRHQPPSTTQTLISGALWGILLLTKVQGILVPPLVFAWSVWRFRFRAVQPLILWTMTGGLVFLIGWPWIWLDPIGNTLTYLGKASHRPTLYVWYLGTRYADKLVPWHYPLVMTVATVPLLSLIFFLLRMWKGSLTRFEQLVLASVLWPLIVFALPGTPVYDGTRLFLVIMPGIVVLAARGIMLLLNDSSVPAEHDVTAPETTSQPRSFRRSLFRWSLLGVVSLAMSMDVWHPFCIDSYSWLVGGKRGAETLGLEASYWADGLNGDFWQQVPRNSTVYVAPVCHQFQLSDLQQLVPIVAQRNIQLVPFEYDPEKQQGLVLLIHRLADLRPALRTIPENAKLVAEATSEGGVLARLIDTTHATWNKIPDWPAIAESD